MKDCTHKQDTIDLREFFNTKIENVLTLIAGNDKNYQAQFINSKEAVSTALAAQEKGTAAAFLAAEKAGLKTEEAQRSYNERSNEFRGQLDDQAKTLMPRTETVSLFKGVDDKFIALQNSMDNKMEAQRVANEKSFDRITEDIKSLRESRSEGVGKTSSTREYWGYILAGLSIVAILVSRFIK